MLKNTFLPSLKVSESVDKRSTIPIGLNANARKIVEGIKDETGIAKQEAVSRVLEWFADQPISVRREILTKTGNAGDELVRLRMGEMLAAGQVDPGTIKTIDDANRVIRLMLDRIEQIDAARVRQLGGKNKS